MRIALVKILTVLFLAAAAACDHKELLYPGKGMQVVSVSFNWRNAPEADPAGMTVIFFPSEGGDIWRFDISGRNGGAVKVPAGQYNVLAFNNDAYSTLLGNISDFRTLYAYTAEYSPRTWFSPRTPTRGMPNPIWSASSENVTIADACTCSSSGERQILTLNPRPVNSLYDVVAEDVDNLTSASNIGATLGGMAWAVTLWDRRLYQNPTDLPFLMHPSGPTTAEASFHPFGNDSESSSNILTLYFLLKDGTEKIFEFDVSEQVKDAPDPRHVKIKVSGIELPEINPSDTIGNNGLEVNVDGWNTVRIDM